VLSYYPDKVYSEMAQLLGKKAAQNAQADAAATREGKIEQFKDFTPEQAKAILEWLLLARSWSDFDGYKDDIEAAIEYWRQRALQRDSRSHKRDN
jgi:outer membrane PBP1 activator LpoA protein